MSFGHKPGEEMKTKLKQSSDLLYCDKGGNITCCFDNEVCVNFLDLNGEVRCEFQHRFGEELYLFNC